MGTNRFGPYCLSHYGHVEPYLSAWKPSWLMLHDGEAKRENIDRVKAVSPDTKIIGRYYRSDSWYNENIRNDPEGTARYVAEELRKTDWAAHVDSICTANEVCQDWSGLPYLDRYHIALQDEIDWPILLHSFSVENPGWSPSDPDGWHASLMKHWALVETSMMRGLQHGDQLGIHQYQANRFTLGDYQELRNKVSRDELGRAIASSSPSLELLPDPVKDDIRRIFRYEVLVWPYLREELQALPVIVSEVGWDFLLYPYYYKAGHLEPTAAISTDDAIGQLQWYCGLWDDAFTGIPIEGFVIYGSGDSGGWEHYNILSTDVMDGSRRDRPLVQAIADSYPGGDWPKVPGPKPPDPPDPPTPEPPMDFERRISAAFEDLGMKLRPLHEREDIDWNDLTPTSTVWVLKDFWTTRNGSWSAHQGETRPEIWDIPQWAKDDYMLPWEHECRFDDAGGDRHVFGACLPATYQGGNVGCMLLKEAGIHYYTWEDNSNHAMKTTKQRSGWANMVLYPSSNFNPDIAEGENAAGPFAWTKVGISDIIEGAGLPWNNHVSYFGVWIEMTVMDYVKTFMTPTFQSPEEGAVVVGDVSQSIFMNPGSALQTAAINDGATQVSNESDYLVSQPDGSTVKYIGIKAEFAAGPHMGESWYYYTNAEDGLWKVEKYIKTG